MAFYSAHTEPVAVPIPNDNRPYIAFKHITIDTNKKTNIQFKVPAKFPPMTLSKMDIRSRERVKALTLLLTLSSRTAANINILKWQSVLSTDPSLDQLNCDNLS